ncbi:VWA domain-containing protein [Litorilinea aerophila]|nr:VWA domain-containing protein [Litorilinea aerophila]MCC9075389.1 VWA domain-containing protein [Litorilinea aerophila]OUC09404.1 hypothetical protein RY27_03030 [Litorilinea aerophila]
MSEAPENAENPESSGNREQIFTPSPPFTIRQDRQLWATAPLAHRSTQVASGRRSHVRGFSEGGRWVGAARPRGAIRDLALGATLRAAALRQMGRTPHVAGGWPSVHPGDLRVKVRQTRHNTLLLFVVDASGSMAARRRMMAVKGAVLGLLMDAYQKRDRVGLIAFRGSGAELLVPPTHAPELAERRLRTLPTGGRTPLTAGLTLAADVLDRYLRRQVALRPLLVLVTDGRANVGAPPQDAARMLARLPVQTVVLDCEQGFVKVGAARELARLLGARYLPLEELSADAIRRAVASIHHAPGLDGRFG